MFNVCVSRFLGTGLVRPEYESDLFYRAVRYARTGMASFCRSGITGELMVG